jgi:acyl carrier protein phosphodiesterase
MNYLAHLFLAGDDDEAKIGELLGDFEKGNISGKYGKGIEIDIAIHRKIDCYTDSHPIIKEAKRLFPDGKRRYAGILLDVFYDHMLAKNWKHYSRTNLEDFTNHVYSILLMNKSILPVNLNEIVPIMIQQDWLTSYQELSGFEIAIHRISRRLKHRNSLSECLSEIEEHYDFLTSSFNAFFPQLIDFVSTQRSVLADS